MTLTIEVTCISGNAKGRELCADSFPGARKGDPGRTVKNYVESEVLIKAGNAWQIALEHTSRIP